MKYFASKKYKIVCREDCYHVKNIKQENLLVYNSLLDAIEDGCRPCKDCIVNKYTGLKDCIDKYHKNLNNIIKKYNEECYNEFN